MKNISSIFLVGGMLLNSTGVSVNAVETCVTCQGYSSVVSDLEELDKYSSQYISSTENIFIVLSQRYSDQNELRTFLYLNYIGMKDDELSVTLSSSLNGDDSYRNYDLHIVSYDTNTNLKKYEVLGLQNLNDTTRKYSLNSINKGNENIINLDGQKYYFNGTNNNNLECYLQEIETIQITDKAVADYCYGNSLNLFGKETGLMADGNVYNDTWYVFFNTDKEIDNLISVELTYTQYDFCIGSYGSIKGTETLDMSCVYNETYVKDFVNNPPLVYSGSSYKGDFYLNYRNPQTTTIEPGTKEVESTQFGWFGSYQKTYETLDNIMDMRKYQEEGGSAFVFTEYANNYTWGVHFNDTSRSWIQKGPNSTSGLITASGITDTAILKLTFEKNGKIKTLNAVDSPTKSDDNKGNSAETPDGGFFDSFISKFKDVLKIVVITLGSLIGLYLLSIVFKYLKGVANNIKGKNGK